MKKLFTLLLIGSAGFSFAQKVVALAGANGTQMFQGVNPFIEAYAAASNGDTLYLPGGNLSAPASFDKSLIIIGAGYHPDSSLTTIKTTISGNINLHSGASASQFQGLEFFGTVGMPNNTTITNVSFSRCKLNADVSFPGNNGAQLFSFSESIILGLMQIQNMVSSTINNCIIQSSIQNSKNNNISNNIFLLNAGLTTPILYACNNNTFTSNIFLMSSSDYLTSTWSGGWASTGNIFINNLFVRAAPQFGNDPTLIDNYLGIDQATIFVNQSGFVFSFLHNYALQNPQNFPGYNGTQVGIFGGLMPWKIGGIPYNPHFQNKIISSQTDENGQLQINVTVEAQDE